MLVADLKVGNAFTAKLLDDRKPTKRIVTRIIKRTNLTLVQTQRADDKNRREVFELPSTLKVA